MLNYLPRLFSPRELVIKPGSLMRLKFIKESTIGILYGSKSLQLNGNLAKIEEYLKPNNNIVCISCDSMKPSLDSLDSIMKKFGSNIPDIIICIGGGSVIDTAKVVNFKLNNQNEEIIENNSVIMIPEDHLRSQLIAIPTTVGSGSEASNSAVMIDNTKNYKFPLVCQSFVSDLVILDPNLTTSLDDILLFVTAMDALTHSVESYCSTLANPLSKEYAQASGQIIFSTLDNIFKNPDNLENRLKLQHAAYLAGLSQNMTSVGSTHAITHSLEIHTGIGHGLGNAIFLPKIIKLNATKSDAPNDFSRIIGAKSYTNLCDWIFQKTDDFKLYDLAEDYFEWGNKSKAEIFVDTAKSDVCFKTNPVPLSSEELIKLFMQPK